MRDHERQDAPAAMDAPPRPARYDGEHPRFAVGAVVRLTRPHPAHPEVRVGTVGRVVRLVGYWGLCAVEFPQYGATVVIHHGQLARWADG
jgi:hypothetical protein